MKRVSTAASGAFASVALRYRHPLTGQQGTRRGAPHWMAAERASPAAADSRAPSGLAWRDPGIARLEAALFLAREPLGSRKLARPANLADGTEARTLIRRLNEFYTLRNRAIRIEEVAGGFRLMTQSRFGQWLRRLGQVEAETRLSAPGMETLAIVAYRQPALRAEIEAIRGVQCGEMLRQLMERELIRIVGRAEELGRPFLYGTTREFLSLFGLRDLEELPRFEDLRMPSVPSDGAREAERRCRTVGSRDVADSLTRTARDDEDTEATPFRSQEPTVEATESERLAGNAMAQEEEQIEEEEYEYEDELEDDEDEEDEEDDIDDEELDDEWEEVEDDAEEEGDADEEDEEWDDEEWEDEDEEDDDDEWEEDDQESEEEDKAE